jgi:putative membrane protein
MHEVLVRYVHFLGIIIVSMTLVSEHILLSLDTGAKKFKRLACVDAVFGVSAVVVLTAGLLLWFVVGKPSAFYSHNWIFHTKLTLFGLIGLLSIYPTIFFIRNRNKSIEQVIVPKAVVMVLRLELVLLLIIPLLAVLMAHGFGLTQLAQ